MRSDARTTALGIGVAALILVAMMSGSGAATLLASILAIVAALLSPITGLIALLFVAPFPRPLVIPWPGLYVAVLGAILMGVVLRLPTERPRLRWPSAEVTLLGAYLVYVATHFIGIGLDGPIDAGASAPLFANITTVVLTFVVARLVIRGRSPVPILASLLGSAVLVAVIALAESVDAEAFFGGLVMEGNVVDRVTGPFVDPNYFGAYLAAAATLAVACVVIARSLWLKAVLGALAVLMGSALILTLSRGALAALVAGFVTLAFTRSARAGLVTVAAMFLITLLAWPLFAEMRFGAESDLVSAGVQGQIEAAGRTGTWLAGLELFLTAPLFGVGWGRFVEEASSEIAAHNWYIAALAETGFVGFLLWTLFIAAVVLALWRQPRSARTVGYSVLAVWMVASLTIEVPIAYGATGPVVAVLAASLAAKWPERDDEAVAPSTLGSAVPSRRAPTRPSARRARAGMRQ